MEDLWKRLTSDPSLGALLAMRSAGGDWLFPSARRDLDQIRISTEGEILDWKLKEAQAAAERDSFQLRAEIIGKAIDVPWYKSFEFGVLAGASVVVLLAFATDRATDD